jgi:hypothetical protein
MGVRAQAHRLTGWDWGPGTHLCVDDVDKPLKARETYEDGWARCPRTKACGQVSSPSSALNRSEREAAIERYGQKARKNFGIVSRMLLAVPVSVLVAASVSAFGGVRPPAALASGTSATPVANTLTPAQAPDPRRAGPLPPMLDRQRRQELQDLQRQSLVAALARFGVTVDWRQHDLVELSDWRERVEMASLLHAEQGLEVDWRTMTLADLGDILLRAAKSTELAAFGVTVDWRRFSWRQLEEIRRAVALIQKSEVVGSAEGRLRPGRSTTRTPAAANLRNAAITDL